MSERDDVCDNQFATARKLLISKDGEMSERLKEHAWKAISSARSDAHQHAPTQFQSTTSRNNDVHRSGPVTHDV
jgi:hypothetical protein